MNTSGVGGGLFRISRKNNGYLAFKMISRSISAAHCCHTNITYLIVLIEQNWTTVEYGTVIPAQ